MSIRIITGDVNFDHIKVVFAVFLHCKVIVSLCNELSNLWRNIILNYQSLVH